MKRKKKTKNKLKLKNIYYLLFSIITVAFLIILKIANIIPNLYYIIITFIIILIYILSIILIKKKKKIGYILSIIFILLYLIITYYLAVTISFFTSFSKVHYNEETYLVLTLKETGIKEIEELKNIGYIQENLNNTQKAIEKLDKKISITKKEFEDYNSLFTSLENKNIESILVEENYYNIKKEEEQIDNYQIIYKIKIRSIVKNTNKTVDITSEPFTIYISGIDVYGDIETVSRSDVNILMTINPETKQILLTSIPRDYYVKLSGTTGYKDKLTHAGNYGVNMSINTIEDLLNIDINYYIRVNFTTLEKLIDVIDGVDVYSEYSFVSYIDNYKFYKGYNHMNGQEALAFSRERKSLPNGDIDRGKNQEAVIDGIIRKVTSKEILYKYTKILNNLKGTFQTNLTDTDITKLIKKEMQNIGGWNITSTHLTGTGSYDYTYSYSSQKLYVTIPNEDSIQEAFALINQVIEGKLLEGSYGNPNNIKYPDKVINEPSKEEEKEENKDIENNNDNLQNDNPLEDLLPEDDNDSNQDTNSDNNTEDNNTSNNEEIEDNLKDILPSEEDTTTP